ncbi:hypothetical protein DPX16_13733 [Anabarilius grahami]|uniref:Uncharacterized protein n=1 Tax=Anabarilius grahami TaxID=495550 RepID=A0A3N0XRU9_ANAGA|nr:hypothetical protein DPX16_13733 [Anabarilius grahami]
MSVAKATTEHHVMWTLALNQTLTETGGELLWDLEVPWTSSKSFNLPSLSPLSSSHFRFQLFSPTCYPDIHQKVSLPHQHLPISFSISFFGENAEKEKGRKTFTSVERERIWPRVCFKFLCLIKAKK